MKIFKNYLYSVSYQLFIIVVPIITVPYISRTLGSYSIGLNAYSSSIISYFVLFSNFGLSLYGNRTIAYYRDDKMERSKKFYEIIILKFLMMLLSLIILLGYILFFSTLKKIMIFQSIQIIAACLDISWFFTGIEDFKKTVTRNFFIKFLSIIAIYLFIHNPEDIYVYILIQGLSLLLGNLTLWSYMRKYLISIKLVNISIKEHIQPALLLFFPQIATTLFVTFNRIILGNVSSFSQTGYFDNSDKIVRIFLALITSLGTVMFPRIAYSYKESEFSLVKNYVKISFDIVSCISFPLVTGLILVSYPFSNLFFGSNFQGIYIVLSLLSIELIFMGWSSIIGQQYMVATQQTKKLTISIIFSLIICLFLSIIFVPYFGAAGAAIVSVLGEFIISFVQIIMIRKKIPINYLFNEIWKYILASIIMYIICKLSSYFITGTDVFKIIILVFIGCTTYVISIILLKVKLVKLLIKLLFKI